MSDKEGIVSVADLPMTFQVKYLGQEDARGLWGIKHTRKPVDNMVSAAKALPPAWKNGPHIVFSGYDVITHYLSTPYIRCPRGRTRLCAGFSYSVLTDSKEDEIDVKYLGQEDARGLWGIKHTRKPVDNMVSAAKALPPGQILPIVKLVVSVNGVLMESIDQGLKHDYEHISAFFNIETISYGVQDLVYTRVFSMIIVKDKDIRGISPFECHAFVCESRNAARRLTYSLAASFQDYSRRVKEMQASGELEEGKTPSNLKKKFAIDLRTPEEIEADLETEA